MTSADAYTKASFHYRNAWQSGAKTGPGFEVYGPRRVSLGWIAYHMTALVAVFGSLGFIIYVGLWGASL